MYAKTDKGFMTLELFQIIMEKLVELTRIDGRKDLPALIYADRPACHDSIDVIKYLYNQDFHLVWLLSNSSQVTQPLDGAPYANLKKKMKVAKDDEILKRTLTGEPMNQVVAELAPVVEREAFTPEVFKYECKLINIVI
mgnify:CR=1 FL=1|jgi:hypothetical protein